MKIAIILNGISRKKKFFYRDILPPLKQKFDVTVLETQYAQHAIELASNSIKEKFDYVIAAGGDGTLNQVLNGLLANQYKNLPTIGIIPLGTGNDFSKTCDIKPDGNQIARLIEQNDPKPTDVGKILCCDENGNKHERYFINVCSMGMGPEVVKRLMNSDRSLGPLLTYLKSITQTFFTHQPQPISIESPNWKWNGKARVVAIANGKSFGNSMYIAPDAKPDDGVLSTFVAGELPLLKFLFYLQKIKSAKKINDHQIIYSECSSVEITSPDPCLVEAEGELMGWLPMKIEILAKRIKFLR
ncbi:MAG: diacylglycerol kinase family lipid kinase [Cyclobacteriaceae bacterium]